MDISGQQIKKENEGYHIVSRWFHWLTFMAIVFLISFGWVMVDLPLSSQKLQFYAWHKWLGLLILALTFVRLCWRVMKPPPPLPEEMSPLFKLFAKLGHFALYGLLILLPLSGWLRSSTAGFEIVLFEVIPIPDLLPKNEAQSKLLEQFHFLAGWALLILLVGHVLAALWHHFFRRDHVLMSMRPTPLLAVLAVIAFIGALLFYGTFASQEKTGTSATDKSQKGSNTVLQEESDGKAEQAINEKLMTTKSVQQWQLIPEKSKFQFTAVQKAAAVTGTFKSYSMTFSFDDQKLDQSRLSVLVDIQGMTIGNRLMDQTLHGPSWFDVSQFPTATFEASQFEKIGEGQYRVQGNVIIRGINQPLQFDFTLSNLKDEKEGKGAKQPIIKINAEFNIKRLDFGIGQNEWANTDQLANEVKINLNIFARPKIPDYQ